MLTNAGLPSDPCPLSDPSTQTGWLIMKFFLSTPSYCSDKSGSLWGRVKLLTPLFLQFPSCHAEPAAMTQRLQDAWGRSAVTDTQAEPCHPDTADWSLPDSTQVGHDRSHHLHLACTLSVPSLLSVLRKRQQNEESSRSTRGENSLKVKAKGLLQQLLHFGCHSLSD